MGQALADSEPDSIILGVLRGHKRLDLDNGPARVTAYPKTGTGTSKARSQSPFSDRLQFCQRRVASRRSLISAGISIDSN